MAKPKDITGQRFGRLVAVKRAENAGKYTRWECLCDCGELKIVHTSNLTSGATRSCGCLRKEVCIKHASSLSGSERSKSFIKRDTIEKGTRLSTLNPMRKIRSNNKSGTTGVSWHERSQKWRATIRFKGEVKHIGLYTNKQDAINARKAAEEKYFKPFLEKYGKSEGLK